MKLKKFYDLLHKSATVTLQDGVSGMIFYNGPVKSIPDEYDDWTVLDFVMDNDGNLTFDIERVEE